MRESGRSHEAIQPVLKASLFLDRYTKEPTDTTSNGTGPRLKERLCNSLEEKLDGEVSLRVAA